MKTWELAVIKLKKAGYKVYPHKGRFIVSRGASAIALTKDELIRFSEVTK